MCQTAPRCDVVQQILGDLGDLGDLETLTPLAQTLDTNSCAMSLADIVECSRDCEVEWEPCLAAVTLSAPEYTLGPYGEANCCLLRASKDGDIVGIKQALEAGADINTRLPVRMRLDVREDWLQEELMKLKGGSLTPLMHASREGHAEAVRLLLGRGANPDLQEVDGMQALHLAAQSAAAECFRALLAAGANPLAKDYFGRDALQCVPLVSISRSSGRREWLTLLKESAGIPGMVAKVVLAEEHKGRQEAAGMPGLSVVSTQHNKQLMYYLGWCARV